jgi:hypothetical protein
MRAVVMAELELLLGMTTVHFSGVVIAGVQLGEQKRENFYATLSLSFDPLSVPI